MKKLVYLAACAIIGLSLMGCSSTLKDQARQMETVYFANNSAVISQSDQTKINNFVINHKGSCRGCAYLIQVDGYTNTIGTEAYNLKLSERRADAVKKALVKAGVTPCRIQTKGYGELNPIADNKTAEGLKLNRRATIFLSTQFDKNLCKGKKINCQCGSTCTCMTNKTTDCPCGSKCPCKKFDQMDCPCGIACTCPDTAVCKGGTTPCTKGCKCTK